MSFTRSSVLYDFQTLNAGEVTNRVRVTNVDGREFIRSVPTEAWNYTFPPEVPTSRRRGKEKQVATLSSPNPTQVTPKVKRRIDHFVMNLPGTALEFLDAFRGLLTSLRNEPGFEEDYDVMPMIHCHCFTRELERPGAERDIRTVRHLSFVLLDRS
jgi:tRNA (guanine37-N1)-methyltransferase